jgi:hypothetical protein
MPKSPELIQTQRLDLHLIPIPELIMLHEDPDNASLLSDRDFTNPHRELTHEHSGPLRWRVPQVKADPKYQRLVYSLDSSAGNQRSSWVN